MLLWPRAMHAPCFLAPRLRVLFKKKKSQHSNTPCPLRAPCVIRSPGPHYASEDHQNQLKIYQYRQIGVGIGRGQPGVHWGGLAGAFRGSAP